MIGKPLNTSYFFLPFFVLLFGLVWFDLGRVWIGFLFVCCFFVFFFACLFLEGGWGGGGGDGVFCIAFFCFV